MTSSVLSPPSDFFAFLPFLFSGGPSSSVGVGNVELSSIVLTEVEEPVRDKPNRAHVDFFSFSFEVGGEVEGGTEAGTDAGGGDESGRLGSDAVCAGCCKGVKEGIGRCCSSLCRRVWTAGKSADWRVGEVCRRPG